MYNEKFECTDNGVQNDATESANMFPDGNNRDAEDGIKAGPEKKKIKPKFNDKLRKTSKPSKEIDENERRQSRCCFSKIFKSQRKEQLNRIEQDIEDLLTRLQKIDAKVESHKKSLDSDIVPLIKFILIISTKVKSCEKSLDSYTKAQNQDGLANQIEKCMEILRTGLQTIDTKVELCRKSLASYTEAQNQEGLVDKIEQCNKQLSITMHEIKAELVECQQTIVDKFESINKNGTDVLTDKLMRFESTANEITEQLHAIEEQINDIYTKDRHSSADMEKRIADGQRALLNKMDSLAERTVDLSQEYDKWWYKVGTRAYGLLGDINKMAKDAIENGHIEMLKYYHEKIVDNIETFVKKVKDSDPTGGSKHE